MKNYQNALDNIEYLKESRKTYSLYDIETRLGNNIELYRQFLNTGFIDFYSYFSVVCHEKYLKETNNGVIFVFRNGGNYLVEFSSEELCELAFKTLIPESTRQKDSLTLELLFISKKQIATIAGLI